MTTTDVDFEVAVIGAGFSGIGMAIALKDAGIEEFVLLEKSRHIGGTWRDNQYPGCCCDIKSVLYCFSFEPNPDWTMRYAPAAEIHAYQRHVAKKFGLEDKIRRGYEIETLVWEGTHWLLHSTFGEQLRARYVVSAVGALHLPRIPYFNDIEAYCGKMVHTSAWDHECQIAGKRVIVIGTGASAIQIIPAIAPEAERLCVIQRSPGYVLARGNRKITAVEKYLYRKLPVIQRIARGIVHVQNDRVLHRVFMTSNSRLRRFFRWQALRHLKNQVRDPELRKKLTPNYELGCKRVLLSDDYYPALVRDNVELVTESIDRFYEGGLITTEGKKIEADFVVMATGFDSEKLFGEMNVVGREGRTIADAWRERIRAHRSIAIGGFPNLFLMYGPNSNLGHSSVILMIEEQARTISVLLQRAQEGGGVIEVKAEAQERYNAEIQEALAQTVWASPTCGSWYKDANGDIFSLWPYSVRRFAREMQSMNLDEFSIAEPTGR